MSLSRTVFGSEFQMASVVQRKARFAIVVFMNGRHSAGVADLFVVDYVPSPLYFQ